jgi:organic hydroperoxide reductase OsmC/OhrA
MKILYSTQATSTGGREGRSLTADGVLAVALSTPVHWAAPAARAQIQSNC